MTVLRMKLLTTLILIIFLDSVILYPTDNLPNENLLSNNGVVKRSKRQSSGLEILAGNVLMNYKEIIGFAKSAPLKGLLIRENQYALGTAALLFAERFAKTFVDDEEKLGKSCEIRIEDLPDEHPTITDAKKSTLIQNNDDLGIITLGLGDKVFLTCPNRPLETAQAQCVRGPLIKYDNQVINAAALRCQPRLKYDKEKDTTLCIINTKILTPEHALIIRANKHDEFRYPDRHGFMYFTVGEKVHLSCSKSQFKSTGDHDKTISCKKESTFYYGSDEVDFYKLVCKDIPTFDVQEESRNYKNPMNDENESATVVKYYFKADSSEILTYKVDTIANNINQPIFKHSKVVVPKQIAGAQAPRTFEMKGDLKREYLKELKPYFEDDKQRFAFELQLARTSNKICIDKDLVEEVQATSPNSFVYAVCGQTGSLLINVAPQWKTIRTNNWAAIEQLPSRLAEARDKDLTVITGTYLWMKVKNMDGGSKNLFLNYHRDESSLVREHPVPLYFFKFIVDTKEKKGTVLVTVNNPYIRPGPDYELCAGASFPNIKNDVGKWEPKNEKFGYSYKCNVDEFFERTNYPVREDETVGLTGELNIELV